MIKLVLSTPWQTFTSVPSFTESDEYLEHGNTQKTSFSLGLLKMNKDLSYDSIKLPNPVETNCD